MRLFSKFLFLLMIAGISCTQLKAQNTYPVISSSIETICISNCIDADSIPYISDSTVIHVVMTCQLFEVTGITSLHVKLGTTNGGSDLLDKTFAFDVSGNVGNGCTYSRTDYTVTLGLGDYNGLTDYFSKLVLERNDPSLGVVSKRRPEGAGATTHSKRKIIFTAVQGTMPD